jgi:hypothetical protein
MANVQMSKSVACLGAAGLLALAGSAFGQNCPNGVNPAQCNPVGTCNGADVIVGDLNGIANYNAVGTTEAFSLGTTSCNIGNIWLNWFDSTNQHPVIGGSMYKLRMPSAGGASSYEQVGQSWLKHGFFALSEGLCCQGCQATNGQHLGVHCSDPYTAARNGTQGPLGPKWQVNAATGVFTYPPANPSFSGSVARRLQVAIADLEVSSANVRYFGASHYVTNDDASAGNKYNNQSYRAVNISGSGSAWNGALSGATQRAQQGIRAWGDTVPGVVESDIFVVNDGLIIVAAQATDLGNGQWHYEYAIQNMNSDRSVQAFTIPVPAGVTITNIGFHDVPYHSGDGPGNANFSGTDWTPSMVNGSESAGSMSWATQTFAENASANALRWGTLYNFRFDANSGPVEGGAEATLTLFKPGTPTSVNSSNIPAPGSLPPAQCPCDHNEDGTLNSQDFFDFTGDFFNNDPASDFNGDQLINSQDFFDFLACLFTPPKDCQ